MKNKKPVWIGIVALILAASIGAGVWTLANRPEQIVSVYPVSMLSYTGDEGSAGESYGIVAADRVQSVYLSDTQTVTRLHVYEGKQVKEGDLLYTYDTTLSDLVLERKDLAIQQMEVKLKTARAELTKLKAMNPMVVTTTNPTPSAGKTDKSPTDRNKLNTVYAGSGTSADPYRFWLSQSNAVQEELVWTLLEGRSVVYVVFQLTSGDKTNTAFDEEFGLKLERIAVEAEPDPTEPSDPSDPTEESGGESEPTEPTESEDGGIFDKAPGTNSQRAVSYTFAMSFFDPKEEPQLPNTQIDWNSGYTQAELTTMREEKQAQINQLEFDIKMGKAELEIMKKEAADGNVYAEFDGVVVSVLEPDNARQQNMPMLKIAGGGGYYVEGAVSELALNTVQIGMEVTVNCWENGAVYTGVVTQIGNYPVEGQYVYGETNVTYYPYRVFIDEAADLQEGAFVSLTYRTGESRQILYLENAFIYTEGRDSFVYVRNEQGLIEKRIIQTGISTDGYATPVYSGLAEDEWIAFPYDRDLREGMETVESQISDLYGS